MKDERQRFLDKDWPQIVATIERLGLEVDELLKQTDVEKSSKSGGKND